MILLHSWWILVGSVDSCLWPKLSPRQWEPVKDKLIDYIMMMSCYWINNSLRNSHFYAACWSVCNKILWQKLCLIAWSPLSEALEKFDSQWFKTQSGRHTSLLLLVPWFCHSLVTLIPWFSWLTLKNDIDHLIPFWCLSQTLLPENTKLTTLCWLVGLLLLWTQVQRQYRLIGWRQVALDPPSL